MPKLYELTGQYLELSKQLEEPAGIPADVIGLAMASVKDQISIKVENIGKLILSINSDKNGIIAEANRLNTRATVLQNQIDGLKQYLLTEMIALGADKIQSPVLSVSVRTNPPSVDVLDKEAVPEQFRRIIPETWEVDKRGIIDNFKATGEIPNGTEIIRDKKFLMIK